MLHQFFEFSQPDEIILLFHHHFEFDSILVPNFAMCDCISSMNLHLRYSLRTRKLGFITCFKLSKHVKRGVPSSKWSSLSINSTRYRDAVSFPSDEHEYEGLDFGLPEKGDNRELRLRREQKVSKDGEDMAEPPAIDEAAEDLSIGEILKFRGQKEDSELVKEDGNIAKPQEVGSNLEELEGNTMVKTRRRMMRRTNVMAKQVISIHSALSLGFVSQLWVDPNSWVVVAVEVKPSLLSGDSDRFLLKEITQVGDVILVEDENVIKDDLKLVGLETLVGYTVVTRKRQSIGKVRGYTFNINSGTVESLELDSFGISLIPSSLVSTYALFVDDVLEVFPDTVVVRNSAMSRIQRLTKGFWDGQSADNSNDKFEEKTGRDGREDYPEKRRKSRKLRSNKIKSEDDWELPMDFL